MNVHLKADVVFLWWWWWVCKVIFVSNPTAVLRLCCRWGCANISAITDFDETLKVASWEHLEQIPTTKLTFVQATFVLVTFVHTRNISAVTYSIYDENLKVASGDHLEQTSTIKLTFIQATFVNIRNISAVTDPMLMKL